MELLLSSGSYNKNLGDFVEGHFLRCDCCSAALKGVKGMSRMWRVCELKLGSTPNGQDDLRLFPEAAGVITPRNNPRGREAAAFEIEPVKRQWEVGAISIFIDFQAA